MNIKKIVLFFVIILSTQIVISQSTKYYNDIDAQFKKAKEYIQQDAYSLAYPIFKKLQYDALNQSNFPTFIASESKYYSLLCGLILDEETALDPAILFSETETNTALVQKIQYHIAEYYYRIKNYTNAINYFNKTGIDNLTNIEISTQKFHKAYSYFSLQQFKEAKPLFNTVRQIKNDANYIDANYYYGFICFYDKQYAEAKTAFLLVEQNENYKNIVPFYLAEIYYFNGERDKALAYTEQSLQSGNQYYETELKQLAGHLAFDKKQYSKALPYLEYYINKNKKVQREDLYKLAFCYYAEKNYNKCIEGFKQLGGKEDSLAQNSMYLLADAYLKTNQKSNARNAFLFCSGNSSNTTQKQVSAFNYAKLSYELGYLNVALKELQTFSKQYATSPYITETKELLVSTLANTSNFKDALELFEALENKSEILNKIYPRILYSRAVELINERQIDKAEILLDKVLNSKYNESQKPFTLFWKGEISYRKDNIDDAILFLSQYLSNSMSNGEINISNAKYSLAYCWLKKGNYTNAIQNFEYVSKSATITSTTTEQDAFLRLGDCYFMSKLFNAATKIYDQVINQNFKTADYATFQKAIIQGALNKPSDKLNLLQTLPIQYPNSLLLGDTYFEIANTHISNEEYAKAITPLTEITKNRSLSNLYPQAYLKLGVALFNLNKNDEALTSFSYLSNNYPNTQESDESIEYIRNIFIETQRPEEFVAFMKKNGKPITYTEADSLSYKSAQIKYENSEFENALKGYNEYLKNYPDGKYFLEANYLAAEINVNNKNNLLALPFYETISSKAPNKFAERSSIQAARIYFFDVKNIVKAESYFSLSKNISQQQENKLEAMRGLLRCQYKLEKWKEALTNAKDLLNEKSIANDDKMMATLIIAKNNQFENKLDEAIINYKAILLIGKTEYSAEANYRIAEILFQQNKFSEAEKVSFDCIKKFGSYELWVTKSYLLLGDIYFKQKDYFNAEATFKSISENATIPTLKKDAEQKLLQVIAEKNRTNQVENN